MHNKPPVITIDGPSGTGKGTISQKLAQHLQWHWLDSGVLYRVLGFAAEKHQIAFDDAAALTRLARQLELQFKVLDEQLNTQILFENQDVSTVLRSQHCGSNASKVAAIESVRSALVERQRAFRQAPGLVTDGRDMGTVIFPDATVKLFLTASAEIRAERRAKQLKAKGINVNLPNLLADIKVRDQRDSERQIAPLIPAKEAVCIDTSELSVEDVFNIVLHEVGKVCDLATDLK